MDAVLPCPVSQHAQASYLLRELFRPEVRREEFVFLRCERPERELLPFFAAVRFLGCPRSGFSPRGSFSRSSNVLCPFGHFGIVRPFLTRTSSLQTWHLNVPVRQAFSPACAAMTASNKTPRFDALNQGRAALKLQTESCILIRGNCSVAFRVRTKLVPAIERIQSLLVTFVPHAHPICATACGRNIRID